MKLLLVLVGTLCLGTVIDAQSTISINVAGNVTLGLASLNSTIVAINNTINKADIAIIGGWTNWTKTLITNLTSLVSRFGSYPSSVSSQLSSLNNTIANLQSMLSSSGPSMLLADSSLESLYASVYQLAEQTGSTLNAAALNMTTQATGSHSASCLQKYGVQLTTTPALMSRFNSCLSAESSRISSIGTNITAQINSSLATAQTFINLLSVCNIPTAAVLNQSWPQFIPQTGCLNTYLTQIAYQSQVQSLDNIVDIIQNSQVEMVVFRVNRCAQLAQYDIQDSVGRTQAAFIKCLTTGS